MAVNLSTLSPQSLIQPNGIHFKSVAPSNSEGWIKKATDLFVAKTADEDRPDGLTDELWANVKSFRQIEARYPWMIIAIITANIVAACFEYMLNSQYHGIVGGIATFAILTDCRESLKNNAVDATTLLEKEFKRLANAIEVVNLQTKGALSRGIGHLFNHYNSLNKAMDLEKALGPLILKLYTEEDRQEALSSIRPILEEIQRKGHALPQEQAILSSCEKFRQAFSKYSEAPSRDAVTGVNRAHIELHQNVSNLRQLYPERAIPCYVPRVIFVNQIATLINEGLEKSSAYNHVFAGASDGGHSEETPAGCVQEAT